MGKWLTSAWSLKVLQIHVAITLFSLSSWQHIRMTHYTIRHKRRRQEQHQWHQCSSSSNSDAACNVDSCFTLSAHNACTPLCRMDAASAEARGWKGGKGWNLPWSLVDGTWPVGLRYTDAVRTMLPMHVCSECSLRLQITIFGIVL